ncbi:hypothetical protein TWF281_009334 [Arthrobotrys megalospora]
MRYGVKLLPACVVLVHLAGTTLALPVLDDCSNDSPSLIKRDAESHVSIPHVVASFDTQPSEAPSPSPKEETHTLQKRAEPNKKGWFRKAFSSLTNKLCGTGSIRQQALIDSTMRQSNVGNSQQDVIRPEGSEEEDVPILPIGEGNQGNQNIPQEERQEPAVIDLGEGNQNNAQDEEELDSPPINRSRRQSIARGSYVRPSNPQMGQGMNYDQPVIRLNADGSIVGTRGSRLPVFPDPRRVQDTQGFIDLTQGVEPIPEEVPGMDQSLEVKPQVPVASGVEQSGETIPQGTGASGQGQSGEIIPQIIVEPGVEQPSGIVPQGTGASGQELVAPEQGLMASGQESVVSGPGSGETEVGDPNELRVSLSESFANPFIPKVFEVDPSLWPSDEFSLSGEAGADEVDIGPNVVNNQPSNGEDQMREGKLPKFIKGLVANYGVPYVAEKTFGIDITPYRDHPGVLRYLSGQRGRNVVAQEAPQKKKGNFIQRLFNGRGREEEPVVVNTEPVQTAPRYNGPVNVQPGWVVNPSLAMDAETTALRNEVERLARLGIDPETAERQYLQRKRLERLQPDKIEARRRANLYDEMFPEGDEGEVYVPQNEQQLDRPQLRPNLLGQPVQFVRPEDKPEARQSLLGQPIQFVNPAHPSRFAQNNPQDLESGSSNSEDNNPDRSNIADEDIGEERFVSFGDNEFQIGEDTANFAGNLGESVQSQGWNLGVSQISGFPQVEANQAPNVENSGFSEHNSGQGAPQEEIVENHESDIAEGSDGSFQTAESDRELIVDPNNPAQNNAEQNNVNFSFVNPNLGESGQLGNSGQLGASGQLGI